MVITKGTLIKYIHLNINVSCYLKCFSLIQHAQTDTGLILESTPFILFKQIFNAIFKGILFTLRKIKFLFTVNCICEQHCHLVAMSGITGLYGSLDVWWQSVNTGLTGLQRKTPLRDIGQKSKLCLCEG